jgi:hypothetical protein
MSRLEPASRQSGPVARPAYVFLQLVKTCLFTETAHNTPRPYRTSQHLFHNRFVTARHNRNHFLT